MPDLNWLKRLEDATEYRELQVVFTNLAAQARTADDGPQLASSIDDAIRRIEQERLRDEDELQVFEEQYGEFRKQQSGAVGWFKRHMPFTETRRQEKQHKDALADQRAEILADNLIITRAQMVKEQLLPPDIRKMGWQPAAWRERLNRDDSVSGMQDFAVSLRELGSEIRQSSAFVRELDADINAFAGADFSDSEDRRRRDADLSAARDELAALKAEIQSEESIRSSAIKRLGQMVTEELSDHVQSFREREQRIASTETAERRAKDVEKTLDELNIAITRMSESATELSALPEKRDDLARQIRHVRDDLDDAQRQRIRLATGLTEHAVRFEEAKDRVEQAEASFETAKCLYDAYLVETDQCEADPGGNSPVAAEYERAQQSQEEAIAEFRIARAPYDDASRKAGEADRQADNLQKQVKKLRSDEEKLSRRERTLQSELHDSRGQLGPILDRVQTTMETFSRAVKPLNITLSLQDAFDQAVRRNHFGSRLDSNLGAPDDIKTTRDVFATLLNRVKADRKSLKRALSGDRKLQTAEWKQRCEELLGQEVAAEIFQTA
jgi:hypothetical protein